MAKVDPKGYLNKSDYREWERASGKSLSELSDDQVEEINEALEDWADEDPDGRNDVAADKLDREVIKIMKRKASNKFAAKTEILVNTSHQKVSELVDAQKKIMDKWSGIAPSGSMRSNQSLYAALGKAEDALEDARKLVKKAEDEIKKLQGAAKRSASHKRAYSSDVFDAFEPSNSSMLTVYEDGSVEWMDEIQTEKFRDIKQAQRWLQNLVQTGRGEWWGADAKKALNWLRGIRIYNKSAAGDFKIQMLDDGDVEWEGSSKKFLEDNDNDPDIAAALKKLKRKGDTVEVGGGAGAEFTLKRALIKIGSTNPELRPHIRKILKSI